MYRFTINDPNFLPHSGCDVSFEFSKGDFHILVGENGVGKSTLLSKFYKQNSELISFVEQRPMDYFYDRRLGKIKELFLMGAGNKVSRGPFEEYWKAFQLDHKEDRQLSSLSGGEGQALKICLGLSLDKEIYFLDEPSQFLDGSSRKALNKILGTILERNKSIVMIEHDLSWVRITSSVHELALEEGKLKVIKSWTT